MAFEIHRPYPGVALIVTELGSILMGAPTDAFKATRKYCTDHELPFPKVLVAPTDMLARYVPQFNPEFFLYDFLFVYGAAFKPELAGERLLLVLDKDQVVVVLVALRSTLTGTFHKFVATSFTVINGQTLNISHFACGKNKHSYSSQRNIF